MFSQQVIALEVFCESALRALQASKAVQSGWSVLNSESMLPLKALFVKISSKRVAQQAEVLGCDRGISERGMLFVMSIHI